MAQALARGGGLVGAWGEFLSRWAWDWFVTLTFREPVPSFRAYRLFRKFVRDVEKAAGLPIAWFLAFEYGPRGGRLHLHVLMLNVGHLHRLYWMDEWNRRAGYARILPFERGRGAAYYVAKYVAKALGEWEVSGLPVAVQPILYLPGAQKPLPVWSVVAAFVVPTPDVRRRRPAKICWRRRDWEEEMLRNGERWAPGSEVYARL